MNNLIIQEPGIMQSNAVDLFLRTKRSENTKKAYRRDLRHFFLTTTGQEITSELVSNFLQVQRTTLLAVALEYRETLRERGLSTAAINRSLATLRSFISYCRKTGKIDFDLSDLDGYPAESYRDTSGPANEQVAAMLNIPDRSTVKGKRDYALLRLLWSNALRRGEIASCDIQDFDPDSGTLAIMGKGKTQKETVSIRGRTAEALQEWLQVREGGPGEPLFIALSYKRNGCRLTGAGIYYVVKATARAAGINKAVSPHRVRHSSITAALEASGGDVARVQRLSRHSKLETLLIYNDRRKDDQGDISEMLEGLA